jgi:DNA-binding transcriptional LysR family regulator
MNLRRVDLNLLVALDALLAERHVTRAASQFGLSQPAMSNALRRLRHVMKDELLIRTPLGMEPTPRALELAEPVRQILRQAERVLEAPTRFDPGSSTIRFRVRMSDVLGYLLMPDLLGSMRREAPGVTLDVVHLPPVDTVTALESDDIDLAVSMDLAVTSLIHSRVLLDDRMVCVMSEQHPQARGRLTLSKFLQNDHIKVSISPLDGRYVDSALSKIGKSRRIAVNVPHWLLVPHLLRHSTMVSVLSEHLALRCEPGLVCHDLPFASSNFSWSLYWHRRNEATPAQRWLREKLTEAATGVLASPSAANIATI